MIIIIMMIMNLPLIHTINPTPSYTQHCSHILPQPTFTSPSPSSPPFSPSFASAFSSSSSSFSFLSAPASASLIHHSFFPTSAPGTLSLHSTLSIHPYRQPRYRNLISFRGGPRVGGLSRVVRVGLSGYWDSVSGLMCLVGSGFRGNLVFDAVFKSVYPNSSVVYSSLVVGFLESLNLGDKNWFFEPVSILGFNRMKYNYTLIRENGNDSLSNGNVSALLIDGRLVRSCQQISSLASYFELRYGNGNGNECGGRNCSLMDGVVGFLPRFMSMNEIDCSGRRMVRVAFVVSNVSDVRNGVRQPLDPSRTLVAEGAWNEEMTRIDFVACRILNFTESPKLNASVGDCSIRLDIELPDTLTLRNWSVISGHVWSEKGVGEPGYFDRIEVRASGTRRAALPGMKYEYTEIERVSKFCAEKKGIKRKGKNFPDPYSQDLKFDMNMKNNKGSVAWGRALPVFVGDRFVQNMYPYFHTSVLPIPKSITPVNSALVNNASVNVAYRIIFTPKDELAVGGRSFSSDEKIIISAEGIYDAKVGRLCMVACWNRDAGGSVLNATSRQDCDIFIDIQFPPRDSSDNSVVKGTIESKRDKTSDPLFFESLDLSGTSLTKSQVTEVFWRMDLEITMILISNTLACVFIGLQLFHVKKHPEVLPFISIVMLTVITLGHMIPLLLNAEAFFLSTHSKKTVLFESGGWLEVNEVLVRVITMVAFLLEVRLLQLAWSARGDNSTQKTALQESDKKVVYYCLPLYIAGALIAWLVQRLRSPPKRSFRHYKSVSSNASLTFWDDIKSYAGFILDAFLVPQIMFNVFSNSKENALSVPYFVGTTIVRLLPHGYDLYRAHSSSWSFDPWYIYADPGMNFYSTTWDILISCLGIVFVVLLYLQQRFGGRWFVPKRFNTTVAYEMVPIG